MTATATKEVLKRVNTRITISQDRFIKSEVKKSKGELTEGDVHRSLLEEAILIRNKHPQAI